MEQLLASVSVNRIKYNAGSNQTQLLVLVDPVASQCTVETVSCIQYKGFDCVVGLANE